MLLIDKLSTVPVYEQIIEGIEKSILLSTYPPGTLIPSLRELSVMLGINPNTIQKAYAELTRRGIILPSPGSGCYVANNALELLREEAKKKLAVLSALVGELRLAGVAREEILAVLEKEYPCGNQEKKEESV